MGQWGDCFSSAQLYNYVIAKVQKREVIVTKSDFILEACQNSSGATCSENIETKLIFVNTIIKSNVMQFQLVDVTTDPRVCKQSSENNTSILVLNTTWQYERPIFYMQCMYYCMNDKLSQFNHVSQCGRYFFKPISLVNR